LAAKLREARKINAELIRGGGGIFDVEVDGKRIYSKHETGRFPTHDEILDKIS